VYLSDTSGQTLVALEDTATPIPGKFFRSFFPNAATLDEAGQLAFLAELSDTANGPAAGRGLFLYDPDDGLQEIARTGDSLAGSTITNVYFNGTVLGAISSQSPDTSLSGLNDAGQVAFAFTLASGQDGIAIWTANRPGDFNGDGKVDLADYTTWRNGLGTKYGPEDYDEWKSHYGESDGAGAAGTSNSQSASVPEPEAILLFAVGLAAFSRCIGTRCALGRMGSRNADILPSN
jgi:hypothetical protein